VIRNFLGHAARPFAGTESAPVLVVATPTASCMSWRPACRRGGGEPRLARHVSRRQPAGGGNRRRGAARPGAGDCPEPVYPEDDPRLEGELTRLREHLAEVPLLVGGRALPAYRELVEKVGAFPIENLAQLGATLDDLRKPDRKAKR